MLGRYPDAIRSFVTILNFIIRMRQYHTRSYQYDQVCSFLAVSLPKASEFFLGVKINKTADRMYALFAICNALSPSRLDDNIANISKERYGEQFTKMLRGYVANRSSVLRLTHHTLYPVRKVSQPLKSCSCTPAQNSSRRIRHHIATPSR
jgi:RNA polymerase I-associated factor PAF67